MIKKLLTASFAARFSYLLFGFISSIIINRFLGPTNKGIFTLILTLSTFSVMFFELGLPVSNIYFYGKKKIKFNNLFHHTLFLSVIFILLALGFTYLFVHLNKQSIYKGINWRILFLVFLLIPVEFFNRIFRGFIDALQKYKLIMGIICFSGLFSLLGACVVLILFPGGVRELLYVVILNALISVIIIFFFIKDKINLKFKISWQTIKNLINYGFKNYLYYMASSLNYRLDFFLIGYFLKPYYVGIYSLSVKMAEILKELPISLNTILLPKISSNKKADVIYVINKGTRLNIFISFLCGIGFIVLGKFLIHLFYGESFSLAYWPLVLLLPGLILFNSIDLLGSFFNLHLGKPMINFRIHMISVIINVILNIILIPKYNIKGAAVASAFSYSLNAGIQYGLYMNYAKVNFNELFIIKRSELKEYYIYFRKLLRIP